MHNYKKMFYNVNIFTLISITYIKKDFKNEKQKKICFCKFLNKKCEDLSIRILLKLLKTLLQKRTAEFVFIPVIIQPVFVFTEREGLNNVVAVEKLNTLFLQSLYYKMKNNHDDYEDKFARLLGIIPVFKAVNKKHSMALNGMKMQKAPVIQEFPELHKEIFDIKESGTSS